MSSLTVILALAATTIGTAINVRVQDHSGVDEPRHIHRAHHKREDYISNPRLLTGKNSTSAGGMLGSVNHGTRSIILNKTRDVSLEFKTSEGYDDGIKRPHVKLVIVMPSVRPDRRRAIRETWSKWGDDRVILRFFTEPSDGDGQSVKALAEESRMHGDIIVQDISGGMNFGLKLLWAMRWMSSHYSFDFFLRLDDDYFLCLERLLDELECLSLSREQPSPIYAGYRACRNNYKASYMDESYTLLSSVIIDRILAASDLQCSGYGSLTTGAWLRVGGPGNPKGDVAFVNDYRLDRWGSLWKQTKGRRDARKYEPVCEQSLGIHRTYPESMYKLWIEVTDRTNTSQSTRDGCESSFRYEDDGNCPYTVRGVDDKYLARDNAQPCDSFTLKSTKIYCGGQGC